MSAKKTWWPYGILGVIILGVILLVALVYISLHQVNLNDNAYMQGYSDVEKNIDTLLPLTQEFLQDYDIRAFIDSKRLDFLSPYAKRPNPKKRLVLNLNSTHHIAIDFIPKSAKFKVKDYEIYASRYYDREYKNHYDSLGKKGFKLPREGRYKLILKIILTSNNKELMPIFLQQDIVLKAQ